MSSSIYPALTGLTWPVIRSPIWKTRTQTSVRGREVRIKDQIYPRWKYQLVYSFLRGFPPFSEIQQMMQFFNGIGGSWDTFLFNDLTDNATQIENIALADGVTTVYQLTRQILHGGFREPITAPNLGAPFRIYLNSVILPGPGNYSVDPATGLVTFTGAPGPPGAPIEADFSYYFRCRFTTDTLDFEQFMDRLWELKKVEFESVLL